MAEKIGSVWAIDIGNTSLKAIRLSNESGTLEVIGFDYVPHGKILSGGGIKEQEKQELIALSVRQFVQQNEIAKDEIIVSVPSLNSFSRFVNLPPVEPKRIPEIVKFEATQQIPFDINEVSWDWQMMTEEGAAEAKVGIFAIKNEVVRAELEYYSRENLQVAYVQIAQMALYNYLYYDRPDLMKSDGQATVVLNIGAENTDLVVCTKSNVWQRTIAMGGNAFTNAIAKTFSLNFEKAERLKRTAPMSKYARQILQAMKPVFSDLAGEIQKSIGFYGSAHPNTKISRIVAMGGGTKMRGLLQYLQQSLQIPIERPDAFKKLTINPIVSAAKFHENTSDFGIVYGLGVQALGLGRIESNLLPKSIARSMAWASKTKYFVMAACLVLLVAVMAFARVMIEQSGYSSKRATREKTKQVLNEAQKIEDELRAEKDRATASKAIMVKAFDLFKHRDILPKLSQMIIKMMPNERNNPQQAELYKAFEAGEVEKIKTNFKLRSERKQVFITSMAIYYALNLDSAAFSEAGFERGIETERTGRTSTTGGMDEQMYMMMMGMGRGGAQGKAGPAGRGPMMQRRVTAPTTGQQTQTDDKGFVVTITGYCPYKQIEQLFDPASVQDDKTRWGIITRLMNIDSNDENTPFELYKKTEKAHFELKTGPVDMKGQMPSGIGGKMEITNKDSSIEELLIDPMTKEVISKEPVLDSSGKKVMERTGGPVYKTNDYWFLLNFKLRWKNAPAAATGETAQAAAAPSFSPSGGPSAPSPPAAASRSAPSRKSSGADKTGFGD